MATEGKSNGMPQGQLEKTEQPEETAGPLKSKTPNWRKRLGLMKAGSSSSTKQHGSVPEIHEEVKKKPEKWSMGVLNDKETEEVPGTSIRLLLILLHLILLHGRSKLAE